MQKLLLFLLLLCFCGCTTLSETEVVPEDVASYYDGAEFSSGYTSSPTAIYSLRNVQKALELVSENRQTRAFQLQPTHHYVRFLPQNETDIYILSDSLDLDVWCYPFDRELTYEEMQEHKNNKINGYAWQYCLVEPDFPLPTEMACELLDYVYLQPDDEETITRSGKTYQLSAADYEAIIDKSVELTGKALPETRDTWIPSASVVYYSATNQTTIPLQNVLVRANTDFNSGDVYTDANGYVSIPSGWGGKFRNSVHYKIIWRTDDWKIHDDLGKAKYEHDRWQREHWNCVFDERTKNEETMCATMHWALHIYFYESPESTAGLVKWRPTKADPLKLRMMWDSNPNTNWTGRCIPFFYNDIQVRNPEGGHRENTEHFATTIHELGHASMYQALKDWDELSRWNDFNLPALESGDNDLFETWAQGVAYVYIEEYIAQGL